MCGYNKIILKLLKQRNHENQNNANHSSVLFEHTLFAVVGRLTNDMYFIIILVGQRPTRAGNSDTLSPSETDSFNSAPRLGGYSIRSFPTIIDSQSLAFRY
jgi:hypothetical protein